MAGFNSKNELAAMELYEEAMELSSEKRQAFIAGTSKYSDDVKKRALALVLSESKSLKSLRTGGAMDLEDDDETVPDRVGAYRILRLLGRGGMGAVYLGERASDDFEHVVAIKVIKTGLLSDQLIERFQRERQTLAQLSHPNIARLYDGGTLGAGAPYIVMEYIDGLPIMDWANNVEAPEAEWLSLFLSVCDAVSHAHQNLIVHRDISPSNILVDRTGQPKLIDFGIAKISDDESLSEAEGNSLVSFSFTPGFAAPERSRTGGTSTLSDIYSLGKMLEALVGADASNDELAAIIAKATREDPGQRYATVDALREDVQRYKGGFPVEALDSSAAYRIRKFVTRNKAGSAIGAAVVLAFLVTFAVTLYQYQRAEAALDEADSRFAEVRELANFQLFSLYDELLEIPGTTKVLSRIADKSRSYLDALGNDPRASSALKLDIALSYKRLSDVLGNPEGANLGRRAESGEMLQVAYDRLTALHRERPQDAKLTRVYAETAFSLSVYKFISEDDNEATVRYARQAERLYRSLAQSGKGEGADYLGQLSASLQAAKPLLLMGKGGEGVKAMKALQADILAYVKTHPNDVKAKRLNAAIHAELADNMSWHYDEIDGDYNEPLQIMTKGLELFQELNAADPDNYELRRSIAMNYYKRAQIYMGLEDDIRTLADMRTAERYTVDLLKIDKDDANAARILQIVRGEMVMTLAHLGRASESIALGQKILDEKYAASQKEPDNIGLFKDYTNGLFTYATAMKTLKQSEKACGLYRRAMANWNIIKAKGKLTDFDRSVAVDEIQENLSKCQ